MISYMGYTETQLNQIIDFWENAQKEKNKTKNKLKLTRKEAIELYNKHFPMGSVSTIDFYIKTGMLELKEEEKEPVDIPLTTASGVNVVCDLKHIEQVLLRRGYVVNKCSGEG